MSTKTSGALKMTSNLARSHSGGFNLDSTPRSERSKSNKEVKGQTKVKTEEEPQNSYEKALHFIISPKQDRGTQIGVFSLFNCIYHIFFLYEQEVNNN